MPPKKYKRTREVLTWGHCPFLQEIVDASSKSRTKAGATPPLTRVRSNVTTPTPVRNAVTTIDIATGALNSGTSVTTPVRNLYGVAAYPSPARTPAQPSRPSSGAVESSETTSELSIARTIAAEVTPSDITLLAEYQRLRSVHPFHIPPLITLPTLYGAIGPQNVDKPLDHLVKLGVLRKYWVGEWCIGVNADLCALALEKVDVKKTKRRRTDTSPSQNQPHVVEDEVKDEESAAREDIFGRFASFLRTPQSQVPSLASSSLQSYMSCSDADLSMLFHAGFLTLNPTPSAPSQTTNTRLPTNTNSTTYYISYPSLSSFLTPLKKQRSDLLAAIKRRRDKTLFERDLTEKETFVKGGGLPWDVVVSDLVGSGTLERAESVSGVIVRIVGRSRGDTRW